MLAHSRTSINVAPMKQGNMLRHITKTTSLPLIKGDMLCTNQFMYSVEGHMLRRCSCLTIRNQNYEPIESES